MAAKLQQAGTLLITGAEGQLGRQAVAYFAKRGFAIAASYRSQIDYNEAKASITQQDLRSITPFMCDLNDEDQVHKLVQNSEQALGTIDALLNVAGAFRWAKISDTSADDFDVLINANVRSAFFLAKHVLPKMQAHDFGRMVFVSARAALQQAGELGLGAYTASKAALNAIIYNLAAEVRGSGITVNALAPTIIDTPTNRQAMAQADPSKWVQPEQLLDIAALLFSQTGAAINGAIVPVAGGL